jgi:hypothetical protein
MEQHDKEEMAFAGEHRRAVDSQAAERYVLDELEAAERDAFEEHFLDCIECSSDVRDEMKIVAGVRAPGPVEAEQVEPPAGRFNWWAAAASVFLATLAMENAVLLPRLAHVQPPAKSEPAGAIGHSVSFDAERGSAGTITIRPTESLIFGGAIPLENAHQPVYIFAIRDQRGVERELNRTTTLDTNEPVSITIRPGFLNSGSYTLLLRGGEREAVLSTFNLEVR